MKKITFFISLLFYTTVLFSQNWLKNLPQAKSAEQPTFFDYQKAFNRYWGAFDVDKGYYYENGVKKKAIGWKQFKRWEYEMEGQIDRSTGRFPNRTAFEVYKNYLRGGTAPLSEEFSDWKSLGPNSSDGGYAGVGRINCIAFHPSDNNTYWVGANSGGLWVTKDNGSTWNCLTDKNDVLAVSDIIIPSDYDISKTIYIATGDKDGWDNNSIGVLKSANEGLTWNKTGLTFSVSAYKMVTKLLIDPSDNQTLIAATNDGVYKTTNGGTTWSTRLTTLAFIDLEYKPGDFNTLYGSTEYGKVFLTSNGGTSFSSTFENDDVQRIEMAVSPNEPNWLYFIAGNTANGLYGIYLSKDNGVSFNQVFDGNTKNLLGWKEDGSDNGGQAFYDLTMEVDPSNAANVLIGGINTWMTTDEGGNWQIVNHWHGGENNTIAKVHADKHSLKFRANGDLFECNDGGIYLYADNGNGWQDKTNGMAISQMYKLGVSQTVPNLTITGLQDNGTKLNYEQDWYDVKGGDGMECIIDFTDPKIQYATYVNGQISRTLDGWNSQATEIQPADAGDGAWVTPYIIDPTNNNVLYAGYADIWKTADKGDSWIKISTMNTSDKIRSMVISPSNTQVLYVADRTQLWKTIDGGVNWENITGILPVNTGYITSLAVKNDDDKTLWVTFSGYNSNRVFETNDAGANWIDISAGIPEIPVYSIVQNIKSTDEINLYIGTQNGVFFKRGSDNWKPFNNKLPNVRIGELEIYYSSDIFGNKLRAATYGRGLWESPLFNSTATDMTYLSSTIFQNNSDLVSKNSKNENILGIEIETDGTLNALDFSKFNFSTNGSTNAAKDIISAKVFYTGTTNSFDTTNQFGSAFINPLGEFSISGNHTLVRGKNYFWLTYDISDSAVINNLIDAECKSFVINDKVETPTLLTSDGNRTVGYCEAKNSDNKFEHITKVSIGSNENISSREDNAYADFSALVTDCFINDTISISTQITDHYGADQLLIWVDWNNDGDFEDSKELVSSQNNQSTGVVIYNSKFVIPNGTTEGKKLLRIRLDDTSVFGSNSSPCGISKYGEVEDYSINVVIDVNPGDASVSKSVICNGESIELALNDYHGDIKWQESQDGVSNWTSLEDLGGFNKDKFIINNLGASSFFRAEVSKLNYSTAYSNILKIDVNYAISSYIDTTVCGTYVSPSGKDFEESGLYVDTLTNISGCDSLINIQLVIKKPTSSNINEITCLSYISPSGKVIFNSGTYVDTITNSAGCDSLISIDLTILKPSASSITVEVCNSYTSPSGKVIFESGNYNDTILNSVGCDSIITLDLTINHASSSSKTDTACESYTWRGKTYTASGQYQDTLENVYGCDSIITLNLTINQASSSTETAFACGSYSWRGITYTASGQYKDTLENVYGCDSIIILNLSINQASSSNEIVSACGSYTWRGKTFTASGQYQDTLENVYGCDSIITLNLSINQASSSSETASACGSYSWRGKTYTTSGQYKDTLENVYGCDSIITLNLSINQASSATETASACGSYTWRGITYNASGEYKDTLENVYGCDSIITLKLSINEASFSTETVSACGAYSWRGKTYTTSGQYTDSLENVSGCDSIVTMNLTINKSSSSSINVTSCGSYLSPEGKLYDKSGNYTDTIGNLFGCDSIINITLNVIDINNEIIVSGAALKAIDTLANFQWLDCNNTYSKIDGAIGSLYTAISNGNYAVQITKGNCLDTSECVNVTGIGILENDFGASLILYPNPTKGNYSIDLGASYDGVNLFVRDSKGQLIQSRSFDHARLIYSEIIGAEGYYFIQVTTSNNKTVSFKVLKQ